MRKHLPPPALRRPARPRRRAQAGVSLVEILISFFVIVIGFLPLMTVLLLAQRLGQQAQVKAVAYSAARQQMETIRSWSQANRAPTVSGGSPVYNAFTVPPNIAAQFSTQVAVQGSYAIFATPSSSLRQVVVVVRWHNTSPGFHDTIWSEVRLNTLIAQEP